MQFGFHLTTEQQFSAYRELRLADPVRAEAFRWEAVATSGRYLLVLAG